MQPSILSDNVSTPRHDTATATTAASPATNSEYAGIGLQDYAGLTTLTASTGLSDDESSSTTPQDESFTEKHKAKLTRPTFLSRPCSIDRWLSSANDEQPLPVAIPAKKASPVSWSDLPQKGQLAILTLARLSEPLTQTSLGAYMWYQLKSFDRSLPDSTIASQAGVLQACFPAAQLFTAILWGRAADSEWCGRKKVILIGLCGTCLSCVGFGFSRSFWQAAAFRVMGGALNGNVGVMRTMISEIIKEKK